jgi:hypothetical protein
MKGSDLSTLSLLEIKPMSQIGSESKYYRWEDDKNKIAHIYAMFNQYTGYFTSDNELNGIENATHNTFQKLTWIFVFWFKKYKT